MFHPSAKVVNNSYTNHKAETSLCFSLDVKGRILLPNNTHKFGNSRKILYLCI